MAGSGFTGEGCACEGKMNTKARMFIMHKIKNWNRTGFDWITYAVRDLLDKNEIDG
jgi:hypothetical protein